MQGCRGKFSPEFNAFLCPWASKPQLIETVFDFFLIPASSHISLLELIVLSIGSQITFFFFLEAVTETILHSQNHQICSSPLSVGLMLFFALLILLMYL